MANYRIPPVSGLVDQQWVEVVGPDGLLTSYMFDAETKSLYIKESQIIIPPFHGAQHVTSDPIPDATCDLHGLMPADDKCKLDALTQTRIGILGFSGAGFPDDGGWLTGDIMLAAGTEFISLERIGSVVRFCVDSPIPLACDCEACNQIFWQQDESDVAAIRPPSCNGKLPGANVYGEVKFYLMPETAILDVTKPLTLLNQKGKYPSLIFKRYDDAVTPGSGELDIVLKRRTNLAAQIGWAFTPGSNGIPQCVWTMGDDSQGNERRFEFRPQTDPGLLGELLYKGHLLTKQMAVVVGYDATVLSTNQYKVRYWDVKNAVPIGDQFTATNVWRYENPENSCTAVVNPKILSMDGSQDILPTGTLVSLWEYKVGESNGQPIRRRFFSQRPPLNAGSLWTLTDAVKFGDLLVAREELPEGDSAELSASDVGVADIRLFERTIWGITGFEDRLILSDDGEVGGVKTDEPSGIVLNDQAVADIDYSLPGLRVHTINPTAVVERPVFLWTRRNHRNVYVKALIGMPDSSDFPPYDLLIRAPIDSFDDVYMKVVRRGTFTTGPFAGSNYVVVKGQHWRDIPATGTLRQLTPNHLGLIWKYYYKAAFAHVDDDGITLIGSSDPFPFDVGTAGTDVPNEDVTVQLLHHDYNAPCVRCEFSVDETSGANSVQLQIKVGILDMSERYELDKGGAHEDDLVRGLMPGYCVSKVMTQDGFIVAGNETPAADPVGLKIYKGGYLTVPIQGQNEMWNTLEVMYRDSQCWVWWNGYLTIPDASASAHLPHPVVVNTPYFPLTSNVEIGKVGLRMFPTATVRKVEVSDQSAQHNEYQYGQLTLI
jgi:hypothetical protein